MTIIDPHLQFAYIKHEGPALAERFFQLIMDIASHPRYVPNINLLYDCRLADFSSIPREDLNRIQEYLLSHNDKLYNRISIIMDDDDYFTSSPWKNHPWAPHQQRVFNSIVQGESWLFKKALAQIKNKYQTMNIHLKKILKKQDCHMVDQEGIILNSTVTEGQDGMPLQGRKVSDILHDAYVYPFTCLIRKTIKTQKKTWMNIRVRNCDYAHCITPIDLTRVHIAEFNISGMGTYGVERLKWHHGDHETDPFSQAGTHHCPLLSTVES